jgi:prolyl oligopeptidase
METPGSAELANWMKEQSDYTRSSLDRIPGRARLLARIHELDQSSSEVYGITIAGGSYFYFRTIPGESVPKVFVRAGRSGAERLLVDPTRFPSEGGGHSEVGWFEPSKDGRYLAYGVAVGGAEWGNLHVIDVDSGKDLSENITRIWAGDGSTVSWLPDNRSFFYLRFPEIKPGQPAQEKQLRSQVHLHGLTLNADGEGDPAVFGFGVDAKIDVPKEAFSSIFVAPGSDYAIANFGTVDVDYGGLYVAPLSTVSGIKTPWKKVAGPSDQINSVAQIAVHGRDLYLLSRKDAPRFKVLHVDLSNPNLTRATVVIAESDFVIEDLAAAKDGLYVQYLSGGISRLHRLAWSETEAKEVSLPFAGAIRLVTAKPDAPGVVMRIRSWTHSNAIYAIDASQGILLDTGWQEPAKVDFSGIESREVNAVSYDGTLVPLTILVRKGAALDGAHPTLIDSYGAYGGFGTAKAYFDPMLMAWLERGGVFAVAHPRGGGEFGESWHRAGMKQTKLNTVFDTIACAQYLVDEHYTTPTKLAVSGASAGGIAVGGAIVWRPDLFAAAIDHSGITDSLRMETTTNGPNNIPEFGSVANKDEFHALYAMSSYVQVRDGTAYPAVLLETGANDPRVEPWIVAKMAARLQIATRGNRPILLRVNFDAGHFGGTTEETERLLADEWSFLLWQFGDQEFQPIK